MQVWSLGSGSSGNCYLVREGGSLLVVEAGLSVGRVEGELARLGLSPSDVEGVLATHEHGDHWLSAAALAYRFDAPLLCSAGTFEAGGATSLPIAHQPLVPDHPVAVGQFQVEAFPLPHDAREPVGFLLQSGRAGVCLATDMGVATDEVIDRCGAADLVILEANHDVEMLLRGRYPAPLKSRILGERGHLSNEDAGRTIARLAAGRPRRFWLAHLSGENNSPRVALSAVHSVLRREGLSDLPVEVALRDRRSLYWDSDFGTPRQLPLF